MPTPLIIGAEHFAAPYNAAMARARREYDQQRASEAMLRTLHNTYLYFLGVAETPEIAKLRAQVALVIVQAEQAGIRTT